MWNWLVREWQWPAAALFAGVFLLAIFPVFVSAAGWPLALVFVQLPIYMIHQAEEHLGDRFRRFVNDMLAGGREALTPTATFWINSLLVWGVDLLALYLAWLFTPAAGLFGVYMTIVNGFAHTVQAVVMRRPNPGLFTSILVFLPVGLWAAFTIAPGEGYLPHVVGLAVAVLLHVVMIVFIRTRVAKLPRLA